MARVSSMIKNNTIELIELPVLKSVMRSYSQQNFI